MSKFGALTSLIFCYLIYGVYLAQYDVRILPDDLKLESPRGFFDYKGVTNVHTQMSSGTGDFAAVIGAAQNTGLDFLSITDTNLFEKPSALAGYQGHLLVMIDGEYSYVNSRLLNIGATTTRHLQGVGRSQVHFADLLSQKDKEPDIGLLVLAHPNKPRYRWSGDYPAGLDGIEVINLKNVWQDAWADNKLSFIMSLFILPFNEKLALLRLFKAPDEEIRLWDSLSVERKMVGVAGADAEAKAVLGKSFLRYPTYTTSFSVVRNHLLLKSELTGNAVGDIEKIAQGMRQGQVYMSLDILGDPKGFNAVIRSPSGTVYPMGSQIKFDKGLALEINLPQKPKVPFDTVIYRDGERMMTSNSQTTQFFINSPGTYRVMVRVIPTLPLPDGKKWIPWIYTNPFYVADSSAKDSGMRTTKPATGGN